MILFLTFRHALKKVYGRRFDGAPTLPYARARDFNIEEERFTFSSEKGWILSGSRYYKKGLKPKALVVFFHGLGDGRASYVRSICLLAKAGYLVYAYDNTGCMESEGNKIYSLEHTVIDQEYFFKWLENDPKAQGLRRYSVGHSWGGYGAAISSKKEYKIEKVIDIAGFNDPIDVISSKLPKNLGLLKPILKVVSKSFCRKYACLKASDIMNESKAEFLYVQGEKDTDVTLSQGYESLKKNLNKNVKIEHLIKPNRGHSVYKDKSSEEYVQKVLKEGILSTQVTKNVEMNLTKATNEDKEIWQKIYAFLEN